MLKGGKMGLKYHFDVDRRAVIMKIEPNSKMIGYVGNINGWFNCDVGSQGEKNLKAIKEYLKHPTEEYLLLGSNAYEVHVKKDFTTISYDYEYCNPQMVPCTLPTKMLCKLLKAWTKAEKKRRKKYNLD